MSSSRIVAVKRRMFVRFDGTTGEQVATLAVNLEGHRAEYWSIKRERPEWAFPKVYTGTKRYIATRWGSKIV